MSHPSRSEKFNHVASGFQALAVTAGLMVGGAWTYFTFVHVDRPQFELEYSPAGALNFTMLEPTLVPPSGADPSRQLQRASSGAVSPG